MQCTGKQFCAAILQPAISVGLQDGVLQKATHSGSASITQLILSWSESKTWTYRLWGNLSLRHTELGASAKKLPQMQEAIGNTNPNRWTLLACSSRALHCTTGAQHSSQGSSPAPGCRAAAAVGHHWQHGVWWCTSCTLSAEALKNKTKHHSHLKPEQLPLQIFTTQKKASFWLRSIHLHTSFLPIKKPHIRLSSSKSPKGSGPPCGMGPRFSQTRYSFLRAAFHSSLHDLSSATASQQHPISGTRELLPIYGAFSKENWKDVIVCTAHEQLHPVLFQLQYSQQLWHYCLQIPSPQNEAQTRKLLPLSLRKQFVSKPSAPSLKFSPSLCYKW